jgi:nitrogen fixation NifU-like protein
MDAPAASAADLYREQILDHGRAPRHAGTLEPPAHRATAYNALCGDKIELSVLMQKDRCIELSHRTEGCLICIASASLMTEYLRSESFARANELHEHLQAALRGETRTLGAFEPLLGVAAHTSRHRCALLPWEALQMIFAARNQ